MTDTNNQEKNIENNELDDAQASTAHDEPVVTPLDPQQQLAELQVQVTQAQDQFLRARAELENTRKRAAEEVTKAHKFAIESFAENLLPVMDSLHAALADPSADSAKIREGVELTLKQLVSALERGHVQEINPVGEKFDPHRHQAISMVPSEQEPNTVVTVLQKGYLIADRVLRPALVTVSQA